MKLLVFYLSGLDRRRLTAEATPFLHEALQTMPHTRVTNLPSNELLPTMLTGCYPRDHGVWGVKLREALLKGEAPKRSMLDVLPDVLHTSWQSVVHQLTHKIDLSAIPPRRRRHFEITRTKYKRRKWPTRTLPSIGGVPSLIGVLGPERSRYVFNDTTRPHRTLLPHIGTGRYDLEFVELYSLDRMQQWHGPSHRKVADYYRYTDNLCRELDAKCRASGTTLVILSDHGHEPVVGHVDAVRAMRDTGVPAEEYHYFQELTILRVWFRTDRARYALTTALRQLPQTSVFRHDDLKRMHLDVDGRYGDLFAMIEPGYIYFPHDFYQPLANLWLALRDSKQRPRLTSGKQRHNHGHRAHQPCEEGLLLFCDPALRADGQPMELIDIAPTLLHLLGVSPPPHMHGRVAFNTSAAVASLRVR